MPSTRENLIATTQELLWERGYAATSPRAILDRAGAGQGSMYHHFDGKESLAVEAFQRSAQAMADRAAAVFDGRGTAVEQLTAYLRLERDALRGCPVGRMAGDPDVLASVPLHDLVAATFDRIRTLLADVVTAGVARGELRRDTDPVALADAVLAVVQGGYVLARAAGDPAPFGRAISAAVALLECARTDSPEDPS